MFLLDEVAEASSKKIDRRSNQNLSANHSHAQAGIISSKDDEMDVFAEHSTNVPIQHRFDPYTQNGGSVLGISPVMTNKLLLETILP
jgi:hypothetical protein